MKWIIMFMMLNTILFMSATHPLSMGLHLIAQTMMTAMLINMMSKTAWFSFIVVIVLLGGMLVLFIYMASIASNEKFKMSTKMMPLMTILMIIMALIMIYTQEMEMPLKENNTYISPNLLMLNKMFNTKNSMITLMLMIYLMYTMIAINNIVKINEGPLRKKN
uniref:NADH-ubiquinone oxidoreductase chain 6 n=1 Tax=Coreidae sp. EMHAU-2015-Zz052308 TaxID=2038648 RepID=A0A343K689_9HEMI|nr:NADH dehydrogenase subunit 6 [Coreidae sp. EMHAU-2015-Zz052308]